jgi:hypothetical protein
VKMLEFVLRWKGLFRPPDFIWVAQQRVSGNFSYWWIVNVHITHHTVTGGGQYSSRLKLFLWVHYSQLRHAKPWSTKPLVKVLKILAR